MQLLRRSRTHRNVSCKDIPIQTLFSALALHFTQSYRITQSRPPEEHIQATAAPGEVQPPQCHAAETGTPTSGKQFGGQLDF